MQTEIEIVKTLGPWGLVVLGLIYIFVTKLHKSGSHPSPSLGIGDDDRNDLKEIVKNAIEDVLAPALDRLEHSIDLQTKSMELLASTNQSIRISMEGIKVLLEVQMKTKGRA